MFMNKFVKKKKDHKKYIFLNYSKKVNPHFGSQQKKKFYYKIYLIKNNFICSGAK